VEILVSHLGGTRFKAEVRGHTVITGEHEDEPSGPRGMWPGELFVAALGMCIGGYVASFCKNHGTAYEGMTVELTREHTRNPSRIKDVQVRVRLPEPPSEQERKAIIRAADLCYVTQSIVHGMTVSVSLDAQSE
jgi:uncharacterized OsmC-like protein